MACYSVDGLPPNPARLWARVQGRCTEEDTNPNPNPMTYVPFLNQTMPLNQANFAYQMLAKGNVLQYRKNSSHLTHKQRYSQIAKGMWVNRTNAFATQNQTYTNPNTNSLKRVNYSTIYVDDGSPAYEPITCPTPRVRTIPKKLPTNSNQTRPLAINPIIAVAPGGEFTNSISDPDYPRMCPQYVDPRSLIRPKEKIPIPKKLVEEREEPPILEIKDLPIIKPPIPAPSRQVIADGGQLVCQFEDICGNLTIGGQQQAPNSNYSRYVNPTSASGVPGPIMNLTYNSLQNFKYYPNIRRSYNEGGNILPTKKELEIMAEKARLASIDGDYRAFTVDLIDRFLRLYNNVGKDIESIFEGYSYGNIEEIKQRLTVEVYNNLASSLLTEVPPQGNSSYDTYMKIHGLVELSLASLQRTLTLDRTRTNDASELNLTITQLREQLENATTSSAYSIANSINVQTKRFTPLSTEASLAEIAKIRPEVRIYIQRYGFPPNAVLEPIKLAEILEELYESNTNN